jgi:predicted metal-dependent hydrolase
MGKADFTVNFITAPRRFYFMPIQIDKLIRSKRRTIALIIERDGSFTVRAPMHAPHTAIESFIQQKEDWITRTRNKMKSAPYDGPTIEKQYIDGEKFLFLGSFFDLKLVGFQRPSLCFDSGFTLSRAAQVKGEQVFTHWYKERAFEIISERVKQYAGQYNFTPKQVKISSAKTRWGSCSPSGTLNFTWRLVMAPLDVVDYVVVHELAHLRVKNHSSKFWKVVKTICPDFNKQRKWLKENGEKLSL